MGKRKSQDEGPSTSGNGAGANSGKDEVKIENLKEIIIQTNKMVVERQKKEEELLERLKELTCRSGKDRLPPEIWLKVLLAVDNPDDINECRKACHFFSDLVPFQERQPLLYAIPFPVTRGAEEIIPGEAWIRCFRYLTEPRDFANLSLTCRLFHHLCRPFLEDGGALINQLHPRRREIEQRELQRQEEDMDWDGDIDENIPHMERQMPFRNYRRYPPLDCGSASTCGTSQATVNSTEPAPPKYLGVAIIDLKESNEVTMENISPSIQLEEDDVNSETIYSYSRGFYQNVLEVDRDQNICWEYIHNYLFEKFSMILAVKFIPIVNCDWGIGKKFTFITKDLFEIVPNLKKLCVGGEWDEKAYPPVTPELFSRVPFLRCLQLWDNVESINVGRALLERFSSQIRLLEITNWSGASKLDWINLKELSLRNVESVEDLNQLLERKLDLPQLKKVSLCLVKSIPLGAIFQVLTDLKEKAPKLVALQLKLESPIVFEPMKVTGLYAPPFIKTLRLLVGREDYVEDEFLFLSRFPFVETLHIQYRVENNNSIGLEPQHSIGVDQIRECRTKESYVWRVLPLLKVFTSNKN